MAPRSAMAITLRAPLRPWGERGGGVTGMSRCRRRQVDYTGDIIIVIARIPSVVGCSARQRRWRGKCTIHDANQCSVPHVGTSETPETSALCQPSHSIHPPANSCLLPHIETQDNPPRTFAHSHHSTAHIKKKHLPFGTPPTLSLTSDSPFAPPLTGCHLRNECSPVNEGPPQRSPSRTPPPCPPFPVSPAP